MKTYKIKIIDGVVEAEDALEALAIIAQDIGEYIDVIEE